VKLSRNLTAVTTNLRENFRLSIPELNLGGGIGAGERHLAPGSLLSLKFTIGVRHIKAQAIVRGARPQAMALNSWTWIWMNATVCGNYCWNWADYR